MPFNFQPALPSLWTAMAGYATGRGQGMQALAQMIAQQKQAESANKSRMASQLLGMGGDYLLGQQRLAGQLALGGQEQTQALERLNYADTIGRFGMTPTEFAGEAERAGVSVPQYKQMMMLDQQGLLAEPADWSSVMQRVPRTMPMPQTPVSAEPGMGPATINVPDLSGLLQEPQYTAPQKHQISRYVGAMQEIQQNPDFEPWERADAVNRLQQQIAQIRPVRLPKPDIQTPQQRTNQQVDFTSHPGSAVIHQANGQIRVTNVGSNPIEKFDLTTSQGVDSYLALRVRPDPHNPDAPGRWVLNSKGDWNWESWKTPVDLHVDPKFRAMASAELESELGKYPTTEQVDQRIDEIANRKAAGTISFPGAGEGGNVSEQEFYQRRAAAEMGTNGQPLSPAAQDFVQRVQQAGGPATIQQAAPSPTTQPAGGAPQGGEQVVRQAIQIIQQAEAISRERPLDQQELAAVAKARDVLRAVRKP